MRSSAGRLKEHLENSKYIAGNSESEVCSLAACLESNVNELLKCKEEIFELRSKLKIATETIDMQKAEYSMHIRALEMELSRLGFESANTEPQSNTLLERSAEHQKLRQENEVLRHHIKVMARQLKRMDALETKCSQQEKLIRYAESQKQLLSELFHIQNGEWKPIIEKVASLIANMKQDLSLQPREEEPFLVKTLRDSLAESQRKIARLSRRNAFGRMITESNARLFRQVKELHESVFMQEKTQLRSAILAVVFCKRMQHAVKSDPSSWDRNALAVFACKDDDASASKLKDLRIKFAELTQELILAKQDIVDAKSEKKEADRISERVRSDFNEREKQIGVLQNQVVLLKGRVVDLQEEMAALVSPEKYQSVVKEKETLDSENRLLQNQCDDLKREIKEKEELNREINSSNNRLGVKLDARKKQEKKLRQIIAKKDEEISQLNTIIHEKNRQTLLLERTVMRNNAEKKIIDDNLAGITIENQTLRQQSPTVSQFNTYQPQRVTTLLSFGNINPAFLGE